jgi:hypothetical protein
LVRRVARGPDELRRIESPQECGAASGKLRTMAALDKLCTAAAAILFFFFLF